MAVEEVVQGLKYSEIYGLTIPKDIPLVYSDISSDPEKTVSTHC